MITNNKPSTLCWECKKAVGYCSWSDGSFTPVPGWVAEHDTIGPTRVVESYIVRECPLYEKG